MPVPKTLDDDFVITVGDLKESVKHLTEAVQDTLPTDTAEVSVWDLGVVLSAFWSLNDLVREDGDDKGALL